MENKRAIVAHLFRAGSVCAVCGAPGTDSRDLCAGCFADLPRISVACVQCGLPLASTLGSRCGQCLAESPSYSTTLAAFAYEDPVRSLLHQLKFQRRLSAARLLGDLLARAVAAANPTADVIVPVPLHRDRLRERGFNQALELARRVSRVLGVSIDVSSATRVKSVAAQMDLPADQRRKNVKGVFQVAESFNARRVAIIDDVMTTGATVDELARALRRRGVEEVHVWVCARAVLKA